MQSCRAAGPSTRVAALPRITYLTRPLDSPRFGKLRRIGVHEFVDVVEKVDPRVPVLVHLYEPVRLVSHSFNALLTTVLQDVAASVTLNRLLYGLAPVFPFARFVYAKATELNPNFDFIALPTILVYRGGDLFATLTRVTDELGPMPTQTSLQNYLYRSVHAAHTLHRSYSRERRTAGIAC